MKINFTKNQTGNLIRFPLFWMSHRHLKNEISTSFATITYFSTLKSFENTSSQVVSHNSFVQIWYRKWEKPQIGNWRTFNLWQLWQGHYCSSTCDLKKYEFYLKKVMYQKPNSDENQCSQSVGIFFAQVL